LKTALDLDCYTAIQKEMEKSVEQIMVCLLAEIRTNREEIKTNQAKADPSQGEKKANQAKTVANLREMREELRANQQHLKEEILAKMEANKEMMDAWMAEMRTWRKETTACQETTEACLESMKPTSFEIESESEQQEVPKEDAAVGTFGTVNKHHGDRHLAIGRHGQPKKRTQGNGGFQKKLPTAYRRMNLRAIPVWCKGHSRQGPCRDSVERGDPKGRTLGKGCPKLERSNGIRNQRCKGASVSWKREDIWRHL
jgi:hypothetical protein